MHEQRSIEFFGTVNGYSVLMRHELAGWRVFLPGDRSTYPIYAHDLRQAGRHVCTPDQPHIPQVSP